MFNLYDTIVNVEYIIILYNTYKFQLQSTSIIGRYAQNCVNISKNDHLAVSKKTSLTPPALLHCFQMLDILEGEYYRLRTSF